MAHKSIIPIHGNRKSWLIAFLVIIILLLMIVFSAIEVYGEALERA